MNVQATSPAISSRMSKMMQGMNNMQFASALPRGPEDKVIHAVRRSFLRDIVPKILHPHVGL